MVGGIWFGYIIFLYFFKTKKIGFSIRFFFPDCHIWPIFASPPKTQLFQVVPKLVAYRGKEKQK